jgi:hypothetical protein
MGKQVTRAASGAIADYRELHGRLARYKLGPPARLLILLHESIK